MKPRVYLETTIISYLTAWRKPLLRMAADQEATRRWWDLRRHDFDLVVSAAVHIEAARGDSTAAARRAEILASIQQLEVNDAAVELADKLSKAMQLPARARVDALHISVAAIHAVDYLLTWNCRHIANAALQNIIRGICTSAGYTMPVICTPPELMGDLDDEESDP